MSVKVYLTRRDCANLKRKIAELTKELKTLENQTAHILLQGNQYHDNFSYEQLVIQIRGQDSRLREAHNILNRAEIVDPPHSIERAVLGTQVTFLRNGEKVTWEIVGFGQSDPDRQRLAYNTPLASLLIGKRAGDSFSGMMGTKPVQIEILEIVVGGGADENADICGS